MKVVVAVRSPARSLRRGLAGLAAVVVVNAGGGVGARVVDGGGGRVVVVGVGLREGEGEVLGKPWRTLGGRRPPRCL